MLKNTDYPKIDVSNILNLIKPTVKNQLTVKNIKLLINVLQLKKKESKEKFSLTDPLQPFSPFIEISQYINLESMKLQMEYHLSDLDKPLKLLVGEKRKVLEEISGSLRTLGVPLGEKTVSPEYILNKPYTSMTLLLHPSLVQPLHQILLILLKTKIENTECTCFSTKQMSYIFLFKIINNLIYII